MSAQRLLRLRKRPMAFDSLKSIPVPTLQELKELCLRAPNSFNAQPFKCVLVQDQHMKEELAHAMIGLPNARKLMQAPLTAVFLADTESCKSENLLREDMSPEDTFQQRKRKSVNHAFVSGAHGKSLSKTAEALSQFAPIQIPENPIVWAVKQTSFFADHWIIGATELGLSVWPMEGFDERRVRAVVGASDRYYCPVVIPTGYSKDLESDRKQPESPRLDPDSIFLDNKL